MVTRSRSQVPLMVQHTISLRDGNGLAVALRSFCTGGSLGVLLDLDHLPRIVAIFLGRSTLPPGRPFHLAAVLFSGYLFLAFSALFAGLLVKGYGNDTATA